MLVGGVSMRFGGGAFADNPEHEGHLNSSPKLRKILNSKRGLAVLYRAVFFLHRSDDSEQRSERCDIYVLVWKAVTSALLPSTTRR